MKSTPHKTLQKMTALCPASVCSNAKSSGYSKPIATPNKVADSAAKARQRKNALCCCWAAANKA